MNDNNYDFETQIQLYLGGELEPGERRLLEAQLEANGDYRAMLESATKAREAYISFGSAAEHELQAEPLELWPGIRARMQSEGLLNSSSTESRAKNAFASAAAADGAPERNLAPGRGRILRWAGMLSTAAALTIFSLPLWRPDAATVEPSVADFALSQGEPSSASISAGDTAGGALPRTALQSNGMGAQPALASTGAPEPTLTKGGLQPVLLGEETILERLVRLEREAGMPTAVPHLPNQMVGGTSSVAAPRTHRRLE